jgi:hypothetical protein
MKKTKSIFGMLLLTTVLAGNVFAGNSASSGIYSIFESFANSVISFLIGDDGCTTRQCPNCKPTREGGGGDCRPTNN